MSAASTVSPALVRNPSRRQPQTYSTPPGDRPHRASSTTSKPATTPTGLLPSHSQSQTQSATQARPTSSSQQPALAGVARRDYETTNLARTSSSRRSSSRDRSHPVLPPKRTDSTRDSRHTAARPGHSRNSSHMSHTAAAAAAANGAPAPTPAGTKTQPDANPHGGGAPSKRRTTITAQTGQWTLGKTIGAGSMGKVKLAKNLETGEQVG